MVDFAYYICTLGESLIDTLFITKDREDSIQMYGNPGGAPVKVLATAAKQGASTVFIGKLSTDGLGVFKKNKCLST